MTKIDCLNNGYIELLEHMGGDAAVVRAARKCWGSESKGAESDRKLIRHLLTAGHKTPFEFMAFNFSVKAPLFIARQWFRHRHAGICEQSMRHCVAERDDWVPDDLDEHHKSEWAWYSLVAFNGYRGFVKAGMPKEQARAILPQGMYVSWDWTVNGSSLMNFLTLRTDKHAQKEIQVYAKAILELVEPVAPVSFGEWKEQQKEGGHAEAKGSGSNN